MSDPSLGYDVEAIKAANPLQEFLAACGVILKRKGATLQGKCPFHHEQHGAALTVWPGENRWRCFGQCDSGGDVIAALMQLEGVSFKEACERLGGRLDIQPERTTPKRKPTPEPLTMTPAQVATQRRAAESLASDGGKCSGIAKRRGWLPETIRGLALDGHLGIHEGKLAFLYPHGLKMRWQQDGERRISWAFGGNSELWRQERLTGAEVRRIYITEGETDAISLLDAGLEAAGNVAVVALPGASCWRPEWLPYFQGREVLVMTDADAAGEKAAARIAAELAPVAAVVARLNPLALLPAEPLPPENLP